MTHDPHDPHDHPTRATLRALDQQRADALAAAERDVTAKREALNARRRTLARLTELAEVPETEPASSDPTAPA